jgi:two-component system LytT family sensor kinase
VLGERELVCDRIDCEVRGAVVVPLAPQSDEAQLPPAGALIALSAGPVVPGWCRPRWRRPAGCRRSWRSPSLTRRGPGWRGRTAGAAGADQPALHLQRVDAIASFVRTDPELARELILEFAEFTRYSFRAHGEFTTLAEELRSIDRYLTIERARFGERLQVRLQIAPEVLPVGLPFLCLQPLVENAVRHGLSRKTGVGTISITARDAGAECAITIEDDGVGMDPTVLTGSGADESVDRRPARRPHQRGRSAALGLRRPVRACRGDRTRRGHEGQHAGAEIPSRGTRC